MSLTDLIPWPYRLLAVALLAVALVSFGWIKGAGHVQDQWDAQSTADKLVVARTQAAQTAKTQEIDHETARLIARSDDYWRMRQPSVPSGLPGATAPADAATQADSSDPTGRVDGVECSPAAGAADAIVIIEWQRWAKEMQAATAGQ